MANYQVDNIRELLEKEVPQIRTGDAFGVLFGLFASVLILSGLGLGLAILLVPDAGPAAMIGGPLIVLLLSYALGAALDGSDTMVGADIAERSSSNYNDSWSEYGRDSAVAGMQLGLVLMFGQMMAGAVYGTVKYLRERGSVQDSNTSRIAAAFVCQILTSGPQKQESLFAMTALQSCSIEEKREALKALVSSGFVDALPTGVQIAPDKRHHF